MAEHASRATEGRRLGRGLAALLGALSNAPPAAEAPRGQRKTPIELLRANPRNPRKNFDDAEIEDLANSIRERGVIQPILVRTLSAAGEGYEIVAGERRWRAAQRAGLHEVPIIVIEASDKDALDIAIIENVQRSDLNAIEEATGYAQLMEEHGYSQAEVAHIIGKSRSHVANTLRLLNLPARARELLVSGEISAGHARALLARRSRRRRAAHRRRGPDGARRRAPRAGRGGAQRKQKDAATARSARRRHACASGQTRARARNESHDPS